MQRWTCLALLGAIACGAPRSEPAREPTPFHADQVVIDPPAPDEPPIPEQPPAPLAELRWPAPEAQFSSTADVALFWDGEGAARVCADERCEVVLAADVPLGEGGLPPAPPGPLFWSVVQGTRATSPQRFWVGATGPDFEPLATEVARPLAEGEGPERQVRFTRGEAPWIARVHACSVDEEIMSADPGCAVLVLRRGAEARFMTIDLSVRVHHPQLAVIQRPDGEGLVLLEARGLAQHTDVWQVHLVEDGDGGPRRVLRALAQACGWGDRGAECPALTLRTLRASYRDVDRDGDLDLELGVGRARTTFRREPSGRFDHAEAWVDPNVAPPPPDE